MINWTRNGNTGISTDGWMISHSALGFSVFDADERYVGRFETRDEAVEAVTR